MIPMPAAIAVFPTPPAREVTPTTLPALCESASVVSSEGTTELRAPLLNRPVARSTRLRKSRPRRGAASGSSAGPPGPDAWPTAGGGVAGGGPWAELGGGAYVFCGRWLGTNGVGCGVRPATAPSPSRRRPDSSHQPLYAKSERHPP